MMIALLTCLIKICIPMIFNMCNESKEEYNCSNNDISTFIKSEIKHPEEFLKYNCSSINTYEYFICPYGLQSPSATMFYTKN